MELLNVLVTLQSWGQKEVQALAFVLNADGITSDEDGTGLSTFMIEKWAGDCEGYFRSQGYRGGEIKHCEKFFKEHGAIYALYDSSILTYEESLQYLASVNQRSLS